MTLKSDVSKTRNRCREVDESFIAVMLRHLAFRARGKRILASRGVTIRGLDKIDVLERLEVGMSYVGFMDRHDRTLLSVRGRLVFRRRFSIAKGCRFDIGQDARAEFGGG